MAGKKSKILVIDDDVNVQEYLSSLFKDNGYTVFIARDANEGLEKAKENNPDLITLDIEMPGQWGPRFYNLLSQDSKLRKIPVIVISGLAGHQDAVPKAVATLSKPFDRDELLGIVKSTLKGECKL